MESIYASKTSVPVERSQAEIRKILAKYGAAGFAFGEQGQTAMVMFELMGRRVMFRLPYGPAPTKNATQASIKTYEQVVRSRWRALVLSIKAKLECVASQITTFEEEFLAHIVLPNGQTYGDFAIPQIETAYRNKSMPPLLGPGRT